MTPTSRIFSSLHVGNYRLYFTGQLISMAGTWMQAVALAFLVLHLTGSGTQLGLATAIRFLPVLLLSPLGGVVADRVDKRRLIFLTQTLLGALAGLFALLIATGLIRLWSVYLLSLALGCLTAFDNPTRQSFIPEVVPREELANAVTLNSVSINFSRVLGAAAGGAIVAALGFATCFALNAASFAAVVLTLALMRTSRLNPAPPARKEPGQVRAGLRYAAGTPELLVPLVLITVIGTLAWEFQVTLPLIARETFGGDARTYGWMASMMGVGAVVGGLITAYRGNPGRARTLSTAAIGWGVAITAAAVAPTLPLALVAMLFVGYGSISFNAIAKTALQLAAAPEMRGRVMALWTLAWGGSTPIGGPIVGWIGETFGARWSLIAGGVPTILIGLAALPALRAIDRVAANSRDPGVSRPREAPETRQPG
ncbi:MFS transporter [Cryptosporangium phraense]|uniref:MFS transporter n=1 Tax=Cryptosporangium phraense TaxID=2593070 RepID=UPI001478DB60|nr:MFS transporter [Cryptosporangium phraense]